MVENIKSLIKTAQKSPDVLARIDTALDQFGAVAVLDRQLDAEVEEHDQMKARNDLPIPGKSQEDAAHMAALMGTKLGEVMNIQELPTTHAHTEHEPPAMAKTEAYRQETELIAQKAFPGEE